MPLSPHNTCGIHVCYVPTEMMRKLRFRGVILPKATQLVSDGARIGTLVSTSGAMSLSILKVTLLLVLR